jgi:glycolate oxidase iron-sulfur subunit
MDVLINRLEAASSQCAACGLCLPHCPIYRKSESEADSPRGKIAMVRGYLEGHLPASPSFLAHMDDCLGCRACEKACPSAVPFGRILDDMRAVLAPQRHFPHWQRLFYRMVATPEKRQRTHQLLHFYQRSSLQTLVRRSGVLKPLRLDKLESQLPVIDPLVSWQPVYPATGTVRGEVGLFLGCMTQMADSHTLKAAIFLLNRLGFTVQVPAGQTCCGALHQHAGLPADAAHLAGQNARAFTDPGLSAILYTASGCGSWLTESQQSSEVQGGRPPFRELTDFLQAAKGWEGLAIKPLRARVAVHEPCSLRNVLRGEAPPYSLLGRIPGLQIVSLPGNDQCCGAGGAYYLAHPEMAGKLVADKTKAMADCDVDYVVSTNIGCAMHMGSALKQQGQAVTLLHPVVLLAQQLGWRAGD